MFLYSIIIIIIIIIIVCVFVLLLLCCCFIPPIEPWSPPLLLLLLRRLRNTITSALPTTAITQPAVCHRLLLQSVLVVRRGEHPHVLKATAASLHGATSVPQMLGMRILCDPHHFKNPTMFLFDLFISCMIITIIMCSWLCLKDPTPCWKGRCPSQQKNAYVESENVNLKTRGKPPLRRLAKPSSTAKP